MINYTCSNKWLSVPLKYAVLELVLICDLGSIQILIKFLNYYSDIFYTFTKDKVEYSGQTPSINHICFGSLSHYIFF